MRFKIELTLKEGQRRVMPANYQYLFSSWVYRIIEQADPEFSARLHEYGYSDGLRQFKGFCFSRLMVQGVSFRPVNRMLFRNDVIPVEISFYLAEGLRPFIQGLFTASQGQLVDRYGGIDFSVNAAQRLAEPAWSSQMRYESLSPIHLTRMTAPGVIVHLSPRDDGYTEALFTNLVSKYRAFHPESDIEFSLNDFGFELLNTPKAKKITIKEFTEQATDKKAYDYHCQLTAPVALQQVAYHSGLGINNSQGFGLLRVK